MLKIFRKNWCQKFENCWRNYKGAFETLIEKTGMWTNLSEKKIEQDLQIAAGFLLWTRRSCLGVRGTCRSFHQQAHSLQSHPTTYEGRCCEFFCLSVCYAISLHSVTEDVVPKPRGQDRPTL
jgi:hypothetical protein